MKKSFPFSKHFYDLLVYNLANNYFMKLQLSFTLNDHLRLYIIAVDSWACFQFREFNKGGNPCFFTS